MIKGNSEWSVDWQNYDWGMVDEEIARSTPEDTEIQSMPKEQFMEYLRWLGENEPELLVMAERMLKLANSGEFPEELEKLKAEWDYITGND